MSGHPRLYRRGAVYYHRAAVPIDIKDTYPKAEETFSLATKDHTEALRLVRIAAVEVDRRFDQHRRKLQQQATAPVLDELTEFQIKQLGRLYFAHLLEEDEDVRLDGFDDIPEETVMVTPEMSSERLDQLVTERLERKKTFEERGFDSSWLEEETRKDYARGKVSDFFIDEAGDLLGWEGVELKLAPQSPSLRKLARELQAASIKAYEAKSQRNQGQVVETPDMGPASSPKSTAPLLSNALEEWVAEKSRTSWVDKTVREHRVWTGHFLTMSGDKPLDQYGKADARAFKAMLLKLPANWNKFDGLKTLGIAKAAERAYELGMKPMSDRNVNKLLQFVGSFWRWAAEHYDDCPANPFTGMSIKIKRQAREERDPFTVAELRTIFDAPLYTGCQSLHYWSEPGELVPRDAGIYWVPLISLFSGARAGEIIQLYVHDVKEEEGIWYFDINAVEADKHVKNASSWRKIPIHPTLMEIGLLEHAEDRRAQGEQRLFPDLKLGEDGYYSSPFSKHFGRFLKSVVVKTHKNTFHSFRHSFEDACRNSSIPWDVMNAFQGHGQPGQSGRYGHGFDLDVLAEEMKKLQYKGLDLSHLFQTRQVLA